MIARTLFKPGRCEGFSLIELMTVLSIAAILLAAGVPSFQALIQNQGFSTTVNDFFAALNLTRSEAIKRGTFVELAATDATEWSKGWVVFIDENNNHKPDSGEQIIFSHGPVPKGIGIIAKFGDSEVKFIAYNGTGRSPALGHVKFVMGENDAQVRKIVVNFLGRPRVCKPAPDGSC